MGAHSGPLPVETVVEAEEVCGRCEVVCGEEIEGDKDEWFSAASDRFYFFEVGVVTGGVVTGGGVTGITTSMHVTVLLLLRPTAVPPRSSVILPTTPGLPPGKERYAAWRLVPVLL